LDEKVPTVETKEIVDSMLNERKNEKHHSGWMSSAALCTGPNFADQYRGGRGIRNWTQSLRVSFRVFSYLIPVVIQRIEYPVLVYIRGYRKIKYPIFESVTRGSQFCLKKGQLNSRNNSGYVFRFFGETWRLFDAFEMPGPGSSLIATS
jgi:hypothetical protein